MRKIGDLDDFEKEILEYLKHNYISKKMFESWLVVFFMILIFELAFTLYRAYPQQGEIQEIKTKKIKTKRVKFKMNFTLFHVRR